MWGWMKDLVYQEIMEICKALFLIQRIWIFDAAKQVKGPCKGKETKWAIYMRTDNCIEVSGGIFEIHLCYYRLKINLYYLLEIT